MPAKIWNTVAIVGVGLIGGSVGLALQQRGLAERVIGVGRRAATLRKAKQCGAVTDTTTDLPTGVAGADLIVVCTPVENVVAQVCEISRYCPDDAVITDVASTKDNIVATLDLHWQKGSKNKHGIFVGSHPVAGSEKNGVQHARADLFAGRTTVVTPSASSPPAAVSVVERFWKGLGARVVRMTAAEHDKAVSAISHLPHVLATLLAAATPQEYLPLVGGGWLDTTRVAAGDVELWRQILTDNRLSVTQSLRDFSVQLKSFWQALSRNDQETIVRLLQAGKKNRDAAGQG
jgi:prephenate dehydrogenase